MRAVSWRSVAVPAATKSLSPQLVGRGIGSLHTHTQLHPRLAWPRASELTAPSTNAFSASSRRCRADCNCSKFPHSCETATPGGRFKCPLSAKPRVQLNRIVKSIALAPGMGDRRSSIQAVPWLAGLLRMLLCCLSCTSGYRTRAVACARWHRKYPVVLLDSTNSIFPLPYCIIRRPTTVQLYVLTTSSKKISTAPAIDE